MYSLLVSNLIEEKLGSALEIDHGRFLEYTSDSVRNQLQNLTAEATECLKYWPCLIMREGRGEEVVHLVQIRTIHLEGREIKLTLSPISGQTTLVNDALWKLRGDLDIAEFEFSRNHWAVKDRDLFPVLKRAGYSFKDSDISRFEARPLPAPSRRALVLAGKLIADWSHSEIDEFLLEAGVPNLEAGRAIGSCRDRANAIIQFALNYPWVATAENSLFTAYIVRCTSRSEADAHRPIDDSLPDIPAETLTPVRHSRTPTSRVPNRVFVVHGQNDYARTAVVTELNRIGLEAIVLHEQPNMGRHLLTKFIEEAELVTFAVVLMTDDDVGSIKDGKLAPRARQNVILELGYFLSHLGQPRVCALITPGLETPSDFDGIVYIRMDKGGSWKAELARELRAVGMPLVESEV
ncbi:MAG: nucleotide-binding protein [Nitrospira sp.]|nr:nucleotide-binding protein [Nitrospira sp.]